MLSSSELEADIARTKASMRKTLDQMGREQLPMKGQANAYGSLARSARSIGIYYLLLDDSAAVRWFAHAADLFIRSFALYKEFAITTHEQSHWENEPIRITDALYTGLLSGQQEHLRTAASAVDEMDPEYPEHHRDTLYRYYYVQTLAEVATAGENQGYQYDSLREHVNDGPEHIKEYFTLLADVVGGIIDDDPDATTRAIRQLLEHHEDDIDGEPEIPKEYVSVPACALTALAIRSGVSVTVDSQYVPELVFGLHEIEIETLEPLEQMVGEIGK